MSITKTLAARQGPCPFFVLLLPWQTLCQFEHAKRFYCCLWTLGKNSLSAASHFVMISPRLHVEIVDPEARRFLCTFRPNISTQFDFACHHHTAGSKFLRVQVASFSSNRLPIRTRQCGGIQLCVCSTTGHDHSEASCRLQAISFSLSPVVDWSYVKIYCQINGDLYVDYNVRFIRRYTTRNKRSMVLKHFKWLN